MIDWSDLLPLLPWPGERRLSRFLERHPRVLITLLVIFAALGALALYYSIISS
jgi:hypothetical protein